MFVISLVEIEKDLTRTGRGTQTQASFIRLFTGGDKEIQRKDKNTNLGLIHSHHKKENGLYIFRIENQPTPQKM